jgi:hypothetical protein
MAVRRRFSHIAVMREFTFLLSDLAHGPETYLVEVGSAWRARELAAQILARPCSSLTSIEILEGATRLCIVSAAEPKYA